MTAVPIPRQHDVSPGRHERVTDGIQRPDMHKLSSLVIVLATSGIGGEQQIRALAVQPQLGSRRRARKWPEALHIDPAREHLGAPAHR